ncbi:GNAT family N-acetyltransferase [Granulosicoccus sp. 3-233]|uniref:GNAT family N-acetyltransferase n=1 Tax=Granulosicoccus sp. 3-233 TaxID=3417969 RepID=UPI003D335A25
MSTPTIRPATFAEIELMLDWASREGWNPGVDDARLFQQADPDGFFMAFDGEQPAAAISVVRHDEEHGFLGLYICHPDYRGQGFGWAVWQAGMRYLEGKVIGLDGVVEQQNNYRKSGFELAYRNIRFAGLTSGLSSVGTSEAVSGSCRAYGAEDWTALLAMDEKAAGYRREALLASWVAPSDSRHSLVCVADDGTLQAFATIRRCAEGYKAGPVLARSVDHAGELLRQLVSTTSASTLILDVPEPNKEGVELASRIGLTAVFETARMYKGKCPRYQLGELFGVASFELG